MALTNLEFARRTAQIAKRAASWSFDTLAMGDDYMTGPTINGSAERFCREIKEMLDRIHPLARSD